MNFDHVGRFIKQYRTQHSLSLAAMSKKSSVSTAMLCQIEAGRTVPTLTTAARLAEAMQVRLGSFIEPGAEGDAFRLVHANECIPIPDLPEGYQELFLSEESCRRELRVYSWQATLKGSRVYTPCRTRVRSFLHVLKGSAQISLSGSDVKVSANDFCEIKQPSDGYEFHFNKGSSGLWMHTFQ